MDLGSLDALAHVSATALVTLHARAWASRRQPPLLADPQAERVRDLLQPALQRSDDRLIRKVARGRLPRLALAMVALRARHFDAMAADFLAHHPGARVLNLACGLDTRFHRLQAAGVQPLQVVDLDLPPVIALKERLLPPEPGYRQVAADVTDPAWLDALADADTSPAVVLAEGLLMYLDPAAVQRLVLGLRDRLPGSLMVAEVFNSRWLRPPWGGLVRRKLRRRFGMEGGANFRFGVDGIEDVLAWGEGIAPDHEWSAFDEHEAAMGLVGRLGGVDAFRRTQWVVGLRLG